MGLAFTALENPLQDAAIFSVPGPDHFAIFILTEPVHVINPRQLRWFRLCSDLEPVREVIAHVVAAEWKHPHGVPAELADFAGDRCRGLAAGGCSQESAVLPVQAL